MDIRPGNTGIDTPRPFARALWLLALGAAVGVLTACSSSYAPYGYGGQTSQTPSPIRVTAAPSAFVAITDAVAEPATATIRPKSAVEFRNSGRLNMTLRFDSPTPGISAPQGAVLAPGEAVAVTFREPGVYRFGGDMQTPLIGMPSGQLGLVFVLAKPGPTVAIVPVAAPRSFVFATEFTSVRLADPLTWINADGAVHELYLDGKRVRSLGPGESYPMTFSKPGLHIYSSPSPVVKGGSESGRIFVNP